MNVNKNFRSANRQYNVVTVGDANKHTGNSCVNPSAINNMKPFMFIINDHEYIVTHDKVMQYIKKNNCKRFVWVSTPIREGSTEMVKRPTSPYWLIPHTYIMGCAA